jgi:integrase
LTAGEIEQLLAALKSHPEQASADAIRLMMLTGCRRGEALAATWSQFDLAAGVWTKPSAHTKQRKIHRVPLSAEAVKLLQGLRETAGGEFVFPGKPGQPLTDVKRSWGAVTARATVSLWAAQPGPMGELVRQLQSSKGTGELPTIAECEAEASRQGVELPAGLRDVRLHDLRHTYASILASAGLSLPIIGALLGHTQAQTTARYSHLMDDPLRAATEKVAIVVANGGQARTQEDAKVAEKNI